MLARTSVIVTVCEEARNVGVAGGDAKEDARVTTSIGIQVAHPKFEH